MLIIDKQDQKVIDSAYKDTPKLKRVTVYLTPEELKEAEQRLGHSLSSSYFRSLVGLTEAKRGNPYREKKRQAELLERTKLEVFDIIKNHMSLYGQGLTGEDIREIWVGVCQKDNIDNLSEAIEALEKEKHIEYIADKEKWVAVQW